MQCIWTSTSSVLRGQKCKPVLASFKLGCFTQSKNMSSFQLTGWQRVEGSKRGRDLSSLAQAFVNNSVRDTSEPPSFFAISADPSETLGMEADGAPSDAIPTPAKLSRVAAQSVRLACQASSTREACMIVKSLQRSVTFYGKYWYPGKPFPRNVAIDFGMAVSPRLGIHSLLHGLIRMGFTKKAGDVVKQVLLHDPNVRLSDRTLRRISTALCQTDAHALRDEKFRAQAQTAKSVFGDYLTQPEGEGFTGRQVQLPCTRVAIQLFFAAKQYRKQRAKQMFQQLVDACLLQGEILVLSFLFAFLVKQWQARLANAAQTNGSSPSSASGEPPSPAFNPGQMVLNRTLEYISPVIFNDIPPDPHAIKPSHEEAVQALAVLAGLLHEGLLQHSQIARLVQALVLFDPSSSVLVWTLRKGKKEKKWERRDAREYFDEVLDGLIKKVTGREYGVWRSKRCARVGTFNSLLIYSLRRKASPALGERIVKRMQDLGGTATPNITTFNIVMRASTAFRRHDISTKVLETLREKPENDGHAIMCDPAGLTNVLRDGALEGHAEQPESREDASLTTPTALSNPGTLTPLIPDEVWARLSPAIRRILLEDFDFDSSSCSESVIPADGETLAAYIDYLTVSGNAEAVFKLVLLLLPELKLFGQPFRSKAQRRIWHQQRQLNRRFVISRALGLGPLFFTAAVNGLVKAGKFGLATRTWRLAKSAERCSWRSEYRASAPWILPCAAYTVMMQCYADAARKALRLHDSPDLANKRRMVRERRRGGWGKSANAKRSRGRQRMSTLDFIRVIGEDLFRTRQLSEANYRVQLLSYLEQGGAVPDRRNIRLPTPDERFFNAALDLFSRLPRSYILTKKKRSPCRWRRLERRQLSYFIHRGCVRFSQDTRLISILFAMREAGYEIPVAYRHMLVGITVPPPIQGELTIRRRAYANYHRSAVSSSVRLPTIKEHGLPVRNSLKLGRKRTSPTPSSL